MAGTAEPKALRVTLIRFTAVCGLAVGAAVLASPAIAQRRVDLVERGRYLVETIAACGHCYSPQRLDGDRQVELPGLHLARRGWALIDPLMRPGDPADDPHTHLRGRRRLEDHRLRLLGQDTDQRLDRHGVRHQHQRARPAPA